MYKIVDTFNGFEGDTTYKEHSLATDQLEIDRMDFYNIPGHGPEMIFCRRVVPADYVWHWDERQNRFKWG